MRRNLSILFLIVIMITMVFSGCAIKKSLIIRHDIQEDEVDIFYNGISPNKVKQAFGIPHCSHSNFKQTAYIYYVEDGYIKVHFRYGKYVGNTFVNGSNNFLELQPQLEESNDNKGKIDKNKTLMEVRNDISIEELDFINADTISKELQEVLGAPHEIKLYELTNCNWGENINAVIYSLESEEQFLVVFDNKGKVLLAWTEDEQGTQTVIAENEESEIEVKECKS